ncbi:hypothetical protein M5F03_01870 [Acinetobacter sp. ANC 5579]|uniref:hypothetical protein n=1 Tax=Acinetobacter amyesii TaxID=2942470 RepID=UPI0020BDCBC8|nr:hypothetical protein [Acinetobacter amyesii]MCL6233923.1 hypothetical protein [Acinetobacter amyesii]
MRLRNICLLALGLSLSTFSFAGEPSELDQYLVINQILDSNFKIKNKTGLNEILAAISDEDSRTLPYQVDQNMLMEKMEIEADKIEIDGIITTPDFAQFEQSVGEHKVKQLIKHNSLQNCELLFEHQFQRVNPYKIEMDLSSGSNQYEIIIKNTECKFK